MQYVKRIHSDQIQNDDQNTDGANRFHQHPQSMQSLNYFLYFNNIRQFGFFCSHFKPSIKKKYFGTVGFK